MVRVMARHLWFRAYNRLLRPHEVWNIGIVNESIDVFLEPGARPRVRWLVAQGEGSFLADPFAVARRQKLYIFCEQFDYRIDKGRIAFVELAEGTASPEPRAAIELGIHMSHPYLVEHKGTIYCVPETYQAREIGLYKARRFPFEWEKTAILVDEIAGLDATVFEFEDHWWLMCCDNDESPLDRLFVWYSRDLFGPWVPHSANPVKIDISSSRPAGTPFVHDNRLYRPAQDCSRTYGARVVLNRITKLTPTEFEEQPVAMIEPYADSDYPHGLHTLSAAGDITLLDGKRLTFLKSAFMHSIRRGITHAHGDGSPSFGAGRYADDCG